MHRAQCWGTLLQHVKEHGLHVDIGERDRIFYYTTCGWMMWNWLVSALALRPQWYFVMMVPPAQTGTGCSISQKNSNLRSWVAAPSSTLHARKQGIDSIHNNTRPLKALLDRLSLAHESFDYVYQKVKSPRVPQSSISRRHGHHLLFCTR